MNFWYLFVHVSDWPEVGFQSFPGTELGQMAISDIQPELRRQHEKSWLEAYLAELNQPEYTYEMLLEDYRTGGIEKWLSMLSFICGFGCPPVMVQFFHDQLEAFVLDHRAERKARGEDVKAPYVIRSAYLVGV
eukprot:TRINITY_DN53285_c0_g1_i1.p1 TRINITY_DN53285_c0_g1~~TRINITY_DN53285_c0_g1_i1.p1  ORF type:complete len:133 (+),score=5.52 TRINITY_DN53285_c0_g1_i1:92-490(+)